MAFKKINITEEDFKEILNEVTHTFWSTIEDSDKSIEVALKTHLFNVEKGFDPDNWNSCTVKPPKEYQNIDLLIRPKNIPRDGDGVTGRHSAYKVGYYNDILGRFMCKSEKVFNSESDLNKYEYKVIK